MSAAGPRSAPVSVSVYVCAHSSSPEHDESAHPCWAAQDVLSTAGLFSPCVFECACVCVRMYVCVCVRARARACVCVC